MKKLLIVISIVLISCSTKKLQPNIIVDSVKTTTVDSSLYFSLKKECLTLAHINDSLQKALDFENKYMNSYLYVTAFDTTKKIPYMPKVLVVPKKPKAFNNIDSVKAYADSLRVHLIRVNLLGLRVQRYVGLADKNPKKFDVFLKGWDNGLFKNQ